MADGWGRLFGDAQKKYRDTHTPELLAQEGKMTGGGAWYNVDAECWIFPEDKRTPAYLEQEERQGRIVRSKLTFSELWELCAP